MSELTIRQAQDMISDEFLGFGVSVVSVPRDDEGDYIAVGVEKGEELEAIRQRIEAKNLPFRVKYEVVGQVEELKTD